MAKKHEAMVGAKNLLDPGSFTPPDGYKPSASQHGHQKSFTSTRSATHRGHKIKIRTTYRIEIDDDPLTLHTMVMDDGSVHCHGLPNYSFASAVDLTRSLIEASFLARLEKDELGGGGDHDGQGSQKNGVNHEGEN